MKTIESYRLFFKPSFLAGGKSGILRLSAMAARFSLSLYIVHYLGFRAMSSYGFTAAGSAGLITLSGLGLDYRVARSVIAEDGLTALSLVRDRIVLRVLAIISVLAVGAILLLLIWPENMFLSIATIIILVCEPVVYDIQEALISRRRPVAANMVLFVRAAGWIPIVEIFGLVLPGTRTIEWVFWGWAFGLLGAILFASLFCVRTAYLRYLASIPVDWHWIRGSAFTAPIIYISELGFFCQIYNDRFIVAAILGRDEAGLYIFIWTISNSLVPFIQASIFNRTTPSLVRQWKDRAWAAWSDTLGAAQKSILGLGVIWTILLLIVNVVLALYGKPVSARGEILIFVMSVSTIVRLRSDLLHQALYSADRDSDWVAVNLISLVIGPPLTAAAVAVFGLVGAGLQMFVLAICLLFMRRKLLRLAIRDRDRSFDPSPQEEQLGAFA